MKFEENSFNKSQIKKIFFLSIHGSCSLIFCVFTFSVNFLFLTMCCILTFDPPIMPFQRHESCIFHWRRPAWLTIWDKVKSRGTVIGWCTGREWPVNWQTVISARSQSNMPFQWQRKWHIPMASYGKKSHRRAWPKIWDKAKSRATVIDWCAGREWPVNCMTVISAWGRSNMPF